MLEQIELLKTIKADKEDLEDALADKADAHTVNRKVRYMDRYINRLEICVRLVIIDKNGFHLRFLMINSTLPVTI